MEYGGEGTPPPEATDGWRVVGEAAVVLAPETLPAVDPAAVHRTAEALAKERKRRERTPLGRAPREPSDTRDGHAG
jgi:hypothetical protein